jgi:hypothetical protein
MRFIVVLTLVVFSGVSRADYHPEKAQALCTYIASCNKKHANSALHCVQTGLKESHLLSHSLGGRTIKDLPAQLRREGFRELYSAKSFPEIPEGALLILDPYSTLKLIPGCPRSQGDVLVKCASSWVSSQSNPLDFYVKRHCPTKGIWAHPDLIEPVKPPH